MTFADLKTELVARGAEDDATRNGRWINQAYFELMAGRDWPFLITSATGSTNAGYVAVADLRKVIVVGDLDSLSITPGRKLQYITYPELVEVYGIDNIAETGEPEFWWWNPESEVISTYPLGGTTYVKYYSRVAALTGTNEPVFNSNYHYLLVDRAMVEVYKDNDEYDNAGEAMKSFQQGVAIMSMDYLQMQREHTYIQVEPYDG